jgi:hypothetical protein
MKRSAIGTALVILCLFAALSPPVLAINRYGQTEFTSGFWGQKVQWVWAFVDLGPGKVVVWKADSVVARVAKPCTNTVAQSFTDSLKWGAYHRLSVHSKAGDTGFVQACTLIVTGLDSAGAAVTCTTTLADGDTMKWVSKTFSAVYTCIFKHTHASDSALFYGFPIKCVTTTTINENAKVAGVAMDSMAAKTAYSTSAVDGWGRIVQHGPTLTYLVAEERRAGDYICTSTTAGSGTVGTSPAVGTLLGKAMYPEAAAGKWWVFVNTE